MALIPTNYIAFSVDDEELDKYLHERYGRKLDYLHRKNGDVHYMLNKKDYDHFIDYAISSGYDTDALIDEYDENGNLIEGNYRKAKNGKKIDDEYENMSERDKELHLASMENFDYPIKKADIIWESWMPNQRKHFLEDHTPDYTNPSIVGSEYTDLPSFIKDKLRRHIDRGRYDKGGKTKDYVFYTDLEMLNLLREEGFKVDDDNFSGVALEQGYGYDYNKQKWYGKKPITMAKGGLVPRGTPPKYKTRDKKYYTYQNPTTPFEISHHRIDDFGEKGIMHYYKLALYDKDGYSHSSKWIAEDSISKIPLTKKTRFMDKGGLLESRQEYRNVRYEIFYEAPNGYYIVPVDLESTLIFSFKQPYFNTIEDAKEYAEIEINGYLEHEKDKEKVEFKEGGKTNNAIKVTFKKTRRVGSENIGWNEVPVIEDIRTDALFFAKEFSGDITGKEYNLLVADIGKDNDEFFAIYKPQGINKPIDRIAEIIRDDFSNQVKSVNTISYKEKFKEGGSTKRQIFKSCPSGTSIVEILLSKDFFPSERSAKTYAWRHGFKHGNIKEKENYFHLKQEDESKYRKDSFRTINLSNDESVKAIVGCPKSSVKSKLKK